ncbi:PAS domain S-box protein [Candidatus Dojkabacteria bacterium]|uniref:histidine kinase n=1 Tax=Candidatus Dojkabacteria bacterium TaxID=2099670 RepID=A0A955HYM2_9BACT|nr:PAS domain S-box protein [Candidatus Dojkabacteria bacterium]
MNQLRDIFRNYVNSGISEEKDSIYLNDPSYINSVRFINIVSLALVVIAFPGIIILIANGIAFTSGILGVLLLMLVLNVWRLRHIRNLKQTSNTLIMISFVILMLFLMSGSNHMIELYWFFFLPLLIFFVGDEDFSIKWNIIVISTIFVVYLLSLSNYLELGYTGFQIIQFIGAYMVTSLLAYLYKEYDSEKMKQVGKNAKSFVNTISRLNIEKNNVERQKEQLSIILESIGDAVLVLDREKDVLLVNPVLEKITGYSRKDIIGRKYESVLKFVHEKDGTPANLFLEKVYEEGMITSMAKDTVLLRKNGDKIPVADSAAPIKTKEGKVIGSVIVFRDVTEERQIEKMKSEFVSVASHQLRTPLTSVKWFAALLEKGVNEKTNVKAKDLAENIMVSTDRMIKLVNDLLSVSRIETGQKFEIETEDVDIMPILKDEIETAKEAYHDKKAEVTVDDELKSELILRVDKDKIRHVFRNLLGNAIKYSGNSPAVHIGIKEKTKDTITFYVKDNGIGIPKEQQDRIFQKFFRADNAKLSDAEGTGLGLYIVKAIIEGHNGKVWFESQDGKGTAFFFQLPVSGS